MKFYNVPIPGHTNGEEIADAVQANLYDRALGVFADWPTRPRPEDGGSYKSWRDSSVIWNPGPRTYAFFDRDEAGAIKKLPAGPQLITALQQALARLGQAGIEAQPVGDVADPTVLMYGRDTINFISQYYGDFGGVMPKVKYVTLSAEECTRMEFRGTPAGDFPLCNVLFESGRYTSFRTDMAIRFAEDGKTPQFFFWADYVRENPVPKTQQSAQGRSLTDQELVNNVDMIRASGMPIDKQAAAIRKVAK